MVGATSASDPFSSDPGAVTMAGTTLRVWAVCVSPVSGSIFISALP